MKKMAVLSFIVLLMPSFVMAHAGHDHQSQWSVLVHLLWLLPAAMLPIALNFKKFRASLASLFAKSH